MKAFTIVRVSAEDQLKGYGPEDQWYEDILPNAPVLGLEVQEELRRVIQESATGWERGKFEEALRESKTLYKEGKIEAVIFPRVDRETRFLFGSFPMLVDLVRSGLGIYFARERLHLDPNDPESVERYLSKAIQAQAYIETMRLNTMRGRKRRAKDDGMMPSGGQKWAFEYHPYRRGGLLPRNSKSGRYSVRPERAAWVRKWRDWLLEENTSLNECCRRFETITGEKMYPSTMVRILKDPAIIGKFYAYRHRVSRESYGKKRRVSVSESEWLLVYEDPAQAIISEKDFHALQAKFKLNRENARRNTKNYYPPLRGMVRCQCSPLQRIMTAMTTNRGTAYYRCPLCRNHVNAKRLWIEIKDGFTEILLSPERLIPAVKAHLDNGTSVAELEAELASKKATLEIWDQAEDKVVRMHLALPNYPLEKLRLRFNEINRSKERVLKEIGELEQQLVALQQVITDEEGLNRFCKIAASNLDTMDDSRWRLLLESMRLRVFINGEVAKVKVGIPAAREQQNEIVLSPSRRWPVRYLVP